MPLWSVTWHFGKFKTSLLNEWGCLKATEGYFETFMGCTQESLHCVCLTWHFCIAASITDVSEHIFLAISAWKRWNHFCIFFSPKVHIHQMYCGLKCESSVFLDCNLHTDKIGLGRMPSPIGAIQCYSFTIVLPSTSQYQISSLNFWIIAMGAPSIAGFWTS